MYTIDPKDTKKHVRTPHIKWGKRTILSIREGVKQYQTMGYFPKEKNGR